MITTILFLIFTGISLILFGIFVIAGLGKVFAFFLMGQPIRAFIHWRVWALAFGLACMGAVSVAGISQVAAKTPAIEDADGEKLAGSIAELIEVELNGRKEWISIRGVDETAPILLFLAGGPGGSQMAAVRHDLAELEQHFVVVNWDQPGSAKSFGAVQTDEIIVDMYVEDGCALADYLSNRFHWDSIYLVGESWGSALGIMMIEREPELFAGFVGTGQMVDFVETEIRDYQLALEIAKENQDDKKIKQLETYGMPPYIGEKVAWKSAEYLGYLSNIMANNPEIQNPGYNTFRDLLSAEYGVIDKINYFRGLLATFNQVYPQLYGTNLKRDYLSVEVPVAFFLGRHDINAPTDLAETYYEALQAPQKELVWFENSGHSPWINESERFVKAMLSFAGIE